MFQYGPRRAAWQPFAGAPAPTVTHRFLACETRVGAGLPANGRKIYWPLSTLCRAAYRHSISMAKVAPAKAVISAWS